MVKEEDGLSEEVVAKTAKKADDNGNENNKPLFSAFEIGKRRKDVILELGCVGFKEFGGWFRNFVFHYLYLLSPKIFLLPVALLYQYPVRVNKVSEKSR